MSDDILERQTAMTTTINPLHLLNSCIDKGIDLEKLGRLIELTEKWQNMESEKRFGFAMEQFQAKMPVVVKDKIVPDKQGNKKYMFGSYEHIMDLAQPILTQCGISIRFTTTWADKMMTVTCHVRVGSHTEQTSITLGLPDIINANDAQRAGGALSYGQRLSLKAALNIRIVGEDNDAAGLGDKDLSEEQKAEIRALLETCSKAGRAVDDGKFFAWIAECQGAACASVDDIKAGQFSKVTHHLKWKAAGK